MAPRRRGPISSLTDSMDNEAMLFTVIPPLVDLRKEPPGRHPWGFVAYRAPPGGAVRPAHSWRPPALGGHQGSAGCFRCGAAPGRGQKQRGARSEGAVVAAA